MAITRIEELRAKHKALAAKIRREEGKLKGAARTEDTRRKVLVGAALLQAATKDAELGKRIEHELQAFLTKPGDRILFGLPVAEETKAG
jgi:hypothetical protein